MSGEEKDTPPILVDQHGQPLSGKAKTSTQWHFADRIAERVTKFAAAAIIVGTISSFLVSSATFLTWKLSFASIATFSDILSSGITTLYGFVQVSIVFGSVFCFIRVASLMYYNPRNRIGMSKKTLILFAISALYMICFSIFEPTFFELEKRNFSYIVAGFAGLCAGLGTFRWAKDEEKNAYSSFYALAAMGLFVSLVIQQYMYYSYNQWSLYAKIDGACQQAKVIWIGEKTVIAQCNQNPKLILLPRDATALYQS